jgi:hypothetical protein
MRNRVWDSVCEDGIVIIVLVAGVFVTACGGWGVGAFDVGSVFGGGVGAGCCLTAKDVCMGWM